MFKERLFVLSLLATIGFSFAQVTVDPKVVLFDPTPVGDKSDKEKITVKNESDDKVLIGDVSIIGADEDEFDITSEDCEAEILSEGEECTIKVRFEPESKGIKFSVLKFESASYGGGVDINFEENFAFLVGFATEGTDLDVEPDSYEFDDMEEGDEETIVITLRNEGEDTIKIKDYELKTVKIGNIVSTNKEEFDINENGGSNPCGTLKPELDPGEYCTIEVTFIPEKDGYKLAALLFETNEDDSPVTGTVFYADVEEADDGDDDSIFGCNFAGTGSIPIYLLIPVLIVLRRIKLTVWQ